MAGMADCPMMGNDVYFDFSCEYYLHKKMEWQEEYR